MQPEQLDAAARWFLAAESLGDYMGIRYGLLRRGSDTPEWQFVSHIECDGIGGFARLLREHGATIPELPQTHYPCHKTLGPLWNLWRGRNRHKGCARRPDWSPEPSPSDTPPTDIAWHLFGKDQTDHLLDSCRRQGVSVNSLLLKHLDTAVRPELGLDEATLPWMIPVNLRGDVQLADDTGNHVSMIDALASPDDTPITLQQQIRRCLSRGEHRAKHLLMQWGDVLDHPQKCRYLAYDRAKAGGNIGAFSNLGTWEPEDAPADHDGWLFCPPVVTGQRLAAGCVTYRGRLGLVIQCHPAPGTNQVFSPIWMQRWTEHIIQPA